jgi:hypothetical protein
LQTVPVTLTVVQDRVAPTLKSVAGGRSPSSSYVNVEFSEPVTAATAGVAANYGLSGGATVTGVSILSATKVSLVTSPLTASSSYTVTVNGVTITAFHWRR